MRRVLPSLFLVLALCGPTWAGDVPRITELSPAPPAPAPKPVPTSPLVVSPDRFRWFHVANYEGPVTWELDTAGVVGMREIDKASQLFGRVEGAAEPDFYALPPTSVVVWGKGQGTVRLSAFGVVDGRAKRLDTITLLVGPQPPPVPPGPVPPGPVPPVPPGPTPGPVPIVGDGLRVMMLYESADKAKMPPEQISVMDGQVVRSYLRTHCAKAADGVTPEAYFFDPKKDGVDFDSSKLPKIWQDALKRPRGNLPWIVISNGKTGFEGPLPTTIKEAMTLLKQYGGE